MEPTAPASEPVLRLAAVDLWRHTPRGRHTLLSGIDWEVRRGERWALLGHNGAGKSTVLSLAGAVRHPSSGTVDILGRRLGRSDLRELRAEVGHVSAATRVPERLTVRDYVLTGITGTVQPLPGRYGQAERKRALESLELMGLGPLAEQEMLLCSQGEQSRARIARALVPQPRLLLLDEPGAALDLPSREQLIDALDTLAAEQPDLTMVLVTHHLEELPASFGHALLLRRGCTVARGTAVATLTSDHLSTCFGLPLEVSRQDGRWQARLTARRRPDARWSL
ncbi:ABC transporter ATP-binding protein [Peterkaempfera bronchialis]|uniref:ABC transporter ATP-binding protein n=1 Tax=Peterkaempfera bronchialis TaxID=2126346 RepID=UPI001E5CFC2B|nr:ATP-binding cassette domain-containing protein [Peterkaempfera bronchialis]